MSSEKLWGGRFCETTHAALEKLNASIHLDKRMFLEDIEGSKAYSKALNAISLLTNEETQLICEGLEKIRLEWLHEQFIIREMDEDIHTANERRLKELIGDAAAKLHIGRSRNDQVVTDMRLWLGSALIALKQLLKHLIDIIVTRSLKEIDVIMPGYTHLQQAQPVRWSHWLLSHAWGFKSDCDKLNELFKATNIMPLGSGALAGNPFCIDRIELARDLGFDSVTQNSMHAIATRDFVADFLYWASLTGIHLSRLAEDLIIYNTKEFDLVTISDSFSTGSSLMPQKRNPDSLELIRGISGSLFGQCTNLMMAMKGLPFTYNKDLQNCQEAMFSTFDKLTCALNVACGTLESLEVNSVNCKNALSFEMLATDLAYYLVHKGIPFRIAHHDAGKVVSEAERKKVCISELTLEELKTINEKFEIDVRDVWNFENSIERYQGIGGTSKNSVIAQIEAFKQWLAEECKLFQKKP